MSSRASKKVASTDARKTRADMKKYGIVRVPVDYFHFGEFRYTNLDDAIAYAKRNPRSNQVE